MNTRRQFILTTIPAMTVLLATTRAATAEVGRLEETDPIALALGYKNDASQVDTKKFPTFVPGHVCAGCQFYQGTAALGACSAVGGKLVAANGWCAAWVKKS